MLDNFSVSTVAYSGYTLDQAIESLHRIGIKNIELALIKGAVHDLVESDITIELAEWVKSSLDQKGMQCTSFAAHCEMNLGNCKERLLRRVQLCCTLACPRLVLYAPRDTTWQQFYSEARAAFDLAKLSGIKILIENVGDTRSYLLNDADDFDAFIEQVDNSVVGINFDPGNFLSHRPELDVLEHSIASLEVAEHIHIKDLIQSGDAWQCCEVGDGAGRYDALFDCAYQQENMPFFSIESPYSLERLVDGSTRLKPRDSVLSIQDIEMKLCSSIEFVRARI
ncbi:sugar phosphate isomerase/epimerase [Vibrio sp. SCSIO 43140]|uniref:sugar phosphate isomerase/epimerase family protein n=1 Tax=Vibrio sp. SCSIO 43140 TaxID=2819100 RepID=UPI00207534ED|nr:TIM barrel protein [Vibrio sp. SCSIO 43140]USD62443.1 sugar phosphate isomerase/epimerase [Vibrio sp. SCSIO 43140]